FARVTPPPTSSLFPYTTLFRSQFLCVLAGIFRTAAVEQQGEFLAAQTHRHVQGPTRGHLEKQRHLLEGLVAGLVPVAVVVALEVVDITQQHGDRPALALALPPQGVQMAPEAAPVVQAGEAV